MISSIGKPLNNFFSWYLERRMVEIENFKSNPEIVQQQTLSSLISSAKSTKFGISNNFSSIYNSRSFKSIIPLRKYDDFEPFIKKAKNGEPNILWPGKVKWFAQSSGTSSNTIKHIPITIDSLKKCHYKGGKDLLAIYYRNNPNTQLFSGKHLIMGGNEKHLPGNDKSISGDLSAIIMKNLPWWCEWRRSPNKVKSLLQKNWVDKLKYIVKHSSKDNVQIIAGVPSWVLIIMNEVIKENNLNYIHEIWPSLELYLHGGMNIAPYKKNFESISSKKINFYQNYNATEGFFGLQSENDADDMLLMLDYGIYYEFISKDNWKEDQPFTLSLEDVELNTPYEVVISSNGGLWRYRLEDTVIFTSINPFKIKVIGRTKQFINIAGEELMIQHLETAINKASEKCLCSIGEYTVAPVFKNSNKSIGFHYWLIEFCERPDDLSNFRSILDIELQKVNIDYKSKRENNYPLNKPIIKEVPKNTFYNWLESQNKLGGQHKILRINENKDKINEILEMENSN